MMKKTAAALCVLFAGIGVQAQVIYRCGTEYSQTPCPGGKVLESSDPRSAAQRAEAVRVTAEDRRRTAEQARERRALENAGKPATAAGFNGRPPPRDTVASTAERGSGKKVSKGKVAKSADFVAVQPAKPKAPASRP